jgi:hypothetical protein
LAISRRTRGMRSSDGMAHDAPRVLGSSIGNHPDATVAISPMVHSDHPDGRRIGRPGYCPMWTDMFLNDGLRPARRASVPYVGPCQPRRLSNGYALYYRCAQCANVWAGQKPTASRRACSPGHSLNRGPVESPPQMTACRRSLLRRFGCQRTSVSAPPHLQSSLRSCESSPVFPPDESQLRTEEHTERQLRDDGQGGLVAHGATCDVRFSRSIWNAEGWHRGQRSHTHVCRQ